VTIIAALFAITDAGPGALSVDAARDAELKGLGWAVAELAAAGAASAALARVGPSQPQGEGPVETATGGA
jgi:putative oxidoreductase